MAMARAAVLAVVALVGAFSLGDGKAQAAAGGGGDSGRPSRSLMEMPVERYLALGGGAMAGGIVSAIVFDGGPFGLGTVLLGAVMADWMYQQGYWPFRRDRRPVVLMPRQRPGQPAPVFGTGGPGRLPVWAQ